MSRALSTFGTIKKQTFVESVYKNSKQRRTEKLFIEEMTENSQIWETTLSPFIQEAGWVLDTIRSKKSTPMYTIIKLKNTLKHLQSKQRYFP